MLWFLVGGGEGWASSGIFRAVLRCLRLVCPIVLCFLEVRVQRTFSEYVLLLPCILLMFIYILALDC